MSDSPPQKDRFAYYMDLLGHDILNNNQAVLGYLELILASGTVDKKVRKYAEKAVSHMRTSTVLIENVKSLLATRQIALSELKPVDLASALEKARREIVRIFPDRKLDVSVSAKAGDAYVLGSSIVSDLLLTAMITMVRLDAGDAPTITVAADTVRIDGSEMWRVLIEDQGAEIPEPARRRDIESVYSQDSSTAVKMVGMLFCRMISNSLGGSFEVREKTPGSQPGGATFDVDLRRAEGP